MPPERSLELRKQVALARARDPARLLLNEPASGLHATEVDALLYRLAALRAQRAQRAQRSMTVLLIEHRMSLVMCVCDRVIALNFGQVIADGSPAEIQTAPTVIGAYLGAPHAP